MRRYARLPGSRLVDQLGHGKRAQPRIGERHSRFRYGRAVANQGWLAVERALRAGDDDRADLRSHAFEGGGTAVGGGPNIAAQQGFTTYLQVPL